MESFPFQTADLAALAPELVVFAGASAILLTGASSRIRRRPRRFAWMALITVLAGIGATAWIGGDGAAEASFFSGQLSLDPFGLFFASLFLITAGLAIGASIRFLEDEEAHGPEYYFFLLTAVTGMLFMARGIDFVTLFVGLELQALSVYVLVGFLKEDKRSNEGGLKYFILGGFSSGIFLYALSLLYAITGSTSLASIGEALSEGGDTNLVLAALILLTVALGFKVAAVPFHVWAPDAYTGGPTPVSLFITVASKAAAFALLLRVLFVAVLPLQESWTLLLAVLSVGTMTLGNVAAVTQDNIKRLLAYSSIAHAGYALIGVVAATEFGMAAALFYLLAYAFMNVGAWAVVTLLRRDGVASDRLDDFGGLAGRSYWAFGAMLLFMLSLGGIPPTMGFLGKWYVFGAAIDAGWTWLAVIAVVNTAISLYYYLRVVVVMCMRETVEEASLVRSLPLNLTLATTAGVTLLAGLWARPFFEWVQASTLPF